MKQETADTNGKTADACEKLATAFRETSQRADEKVGAAEKKGKQDAFRGRSQLLGQAVKALSVKVSNLCRTLA